MNSLYNWQSFKWFNSTHWGGLRNFSFFNFRENVRKVLSSWFEFSLHFSKQNFYILCYTTQRPLPTETKEVRSTFRGLKVPYTRSYKPQRGVSGVGPGALLYLLTPPTPPPPYPHRLKKPDPQIRRIDKNPHSLTIIISDNIILYFLPRLL